MAPNNSKTEAVYEYETEALMLEIGKEKGSKAKCRLKPVAGGTAIEIGGTKYLVGRQDTDEKKTPIEAMLWPLNPAGMTETEFHLDDDGLERCVLAAWTAQRKVRLVVVHKKDEKDEKNKNRITKITLL